MATNDSVSRLPDRCGKCPIYAPLAFVEPRVQSAMIYPYNSSPFCYAMGFSVMSNIYVFACVLCLFSVGFPIAVFLAIIPVIVPSFNTVFSVRGPWPHISIESIKRVQPFLRHFDTTSTVTMKVFESRIIATLDDAFPCSILRCVSHVFAKQRTSSHTRLETTSTRPRNSLEQVIAKNRSNGSAITLTFIHALREVVQTVRFYYNEICKSCPDGDNTFSWHDVLLAREIVLARLARWFALSSKSLSYHEEHSYANRLVS